MAFSFAEQHTKFLGQVPTAPSYCLLITSMSSTIPHVLMKSISIWMEAMPLEIFNDQKNSGNNQKFPQDNTIFLCCFATRNQPLFYDPFIPKHTRSCRIQ